MAPIAVPIEDYSVAQKGVDNQIANGTLKDLKMRATVSRTLTPEQDLVLKTFRLLIADLCQQFKGGHPGYVFQGI